MKWLLLCYTVPSDTSRHRVAVWWTAPEPLTGNRAEILSVIGSP